MIAAVTPKLWWYVARSSGLVADTYTHFGPSDLLVPFASAWRPAAVAWGVVGFYLLAAIEVTSLLMKRIPRTWWRAVHSSSFVLFVLTSVHALTAGTERSNPAVQWSALLMTSAFIFLTTYRQLAPPRPPPGARPRVAGRGVWVRLVHD